MRKKQARVVLVGYTKDEFKSNRWKRAASRRCHELGMPPNMIRNFVEKQYKDARKLRRKNRTKNIFIHELMADKVRVHTRLLDE